MQVCQGEISEEDKETGAVLKCLVKNVDKVSDSCSHEISRSLRGILQFYQPVRIAPDSSTLRACAHAFGDMLGAGCAPLH